MSQVAKSYFNIAQANFVHGGKHWNQLVFTITCKMLFSINKLFYLYVVNNRQRAIGAAICQIVPVYYAATPKS